MAATVYEVEDPADLDVEKAAFEIFPLLAGTDNAVLRREYAAALADMIGGSGSFRKYVTGNAGDLLANRRRLLSVLKDNVSLLVAKTWVDDKDEGRKAEALSRLAGFEAHALAGDYESALLDFISISDSIACLLFGEDPAGAGFIDYVFRIDPRLGIFYWYVDRLRAQGPADRDLVLVELLVAMYALASF